MQFSIIVPIYNVEKYLSACIDSILAQTYSDYEIILVDDGSTDTSPQICDQYANQYACIHVIHKPNGGLSDARNVGLNSARGEYVFFVDSDDYLIAPNVLQRIVKKLGNTPDVVAFNYVKWFESTGRISANGDDLSVCSDLLRPHERSLELIDKGSFSTSAWSKVIRRAFLTDNHIEFEKGLLGEDNDWYYKVVSHLTSLELINEPLYVYRQRGGSITKTYTNKNLEHLLWIIEKWIRFVNDSELTENKKVIRNDLARQYCHAIIGYSSLRNADRFYSRLKSLDYLLQFSNNPRVKTFRKLNRLVGLRGIIMLLKFRKMFIK